MNSLRSPQIPFLASWLLINDFEEKSITFSSCSATFPHFLRRLLLSIAARYPPPTTLALSLFKRFDAQLIYFSFSSPPSLGCHRFIKYTLVTLFPGNVLHVKIVAVFVETFLFRWMEISSTFVPGESIHTKRSLIEYSGTTVATLFRPQENL